MPARSTAERVSCAARAVRDEALVSNRVSGYLNGTETSEKMRHLEKIQLPRDLIIFQSRAGRESALKIS